jgi:AcrR family transcriptional regulator
MSIDADPVEAVDARRTDTRERAVAVAANLFAEHGYSGTSIRDITDKLGVTKAALYYHFASKEDLLRAIVDEPIARVREVVANNPDLGTPSLRADFVREVLSAFATCPPDVVAVFKDPELQGIINANLASSGVINTVAMTLARATSGVDNPEDVAKDHVLRAVAAVSAGEGMMNAYHVVYPCDGGIAPEVIEQIAAVVMRTLED